MKICIERSDVNKLPQLTISIDVVENINGTGLVTISCAVEGEDSNFLVLDNYHVKVPVWKADKFKEAK